MRGCLMSSGPKHTAPKRTAPQPTARSGIRQVADLAGVSVGTVSRALRGQPGVAAETRRRVQVAADELGYVPSPSAASLASGRTMAVGVVVPYVSRWFFASVVQGAEKVLSKAGYDVLLYDLAGWEDARRRLLGGRLLQKRVDGALVVTLDLDRTEQEALRGFNLPIALVGGDDGFAGVRIDDVKAAVTATTHLLELGHRRIAFIGVEPVARGPHVAAAYRRRGYRLALRRAGVPVCQELELPGDFTVHSGTEAMHRLLTLDDPPTAVFAASDEMAMGCLFAARQAGVSIPGDVSVIGLDDHEMAVLHDLTTVAQPAYEQGHIAANLLLDLLRGQPVDTQHPIVVPTQLVVRQTTGPVREATRAPAAAGGRLR
jgi:LacI family transcriptional regulator, repressor for deo operon, udp, cdd, tsx, nupC, and nupG